MFDKLISSGKRGLQPISELMSINAQTIEKLTSQQAGFISSCLTDSVRQVQEISTKRDIGSFIDSQRGYAEEMQQKWIDNAKNTLDVMNQARKSATSILESALSGSEKTEAGKAEKSTKKVA